MRQIKNFITFFISVAMLFVYGLSLAQDTEPRRWTNLPLGINAAGIGYGYTSGDVLFDPLLETEDVKVTAHTIVASYVRPFKIGKKFARLDVLIPFSNARWEGLLQGEPARVERTGLVDPRVRISYHILGPPALKREQLKKTAYYASFCAGRHSCVSVLAGE